MAGIFKAYDIRGKYPDKINNNLAKNIGYDIAEVFGSKKILLCRDARLGSEDLMNGLVQGFKFFNKEIDIIDAGVTTTPMFYFILQKGDFDFGIMITASHDPKDYCGMKLWRKENEILHPVSYGTGEEIVESLANRNNVVVNDQELSIKQISYEKDYFDYLVQLSKIDEFIKEQQNITVVVDYSNGTAGINSKLLMKTANIIELNKNPDGNFPCHEPNPLLEDSQRQISEKIKQESADFGIIFDGDGDRIVFLDNYGEQVQTEKIVSLDVAEMIKEGKDVKSVVETLNMSEDLAKDLATRNINLFKTRVGYVFVREKAMQENSAITAEKSTHFAYRETGFTDSAILTYLYIIKKYALFKKDNSALKFSDMAKQAHIKNINIENVIKISTDKIDSAIQKVFDYYNNKANKYEDLDGYSFHFSDYWFNIRKSNTMPEIKITIEAENKKKEQEIFNQILEVLNN